MAPWLWIVGGPNGAGKTTFAGQFLDNLSLAFPNSRLPAHFTRLNADERTLALRQQFPDAHAIRSIFAPRGTSMPNSFG